PVDVLAYKGEVVLRAGQRMLQQGRQVGDCSKGKLQPLLEFGVVQRAGERQRVFHELVDFTGEESLLRAVEQFQCAGDTREVLRAATQRVNVLVFVDGRRDDGFQRGGQCAGQRFDFALHAFQRGN